MSVPLSSSRHTKSGGTSGFPGGCPAPTERPLMPRLRSSGIVARVQPGTSRCETAVGAAMPSDAASACGSPSAASKSSALGYALASPL